MLNGLSGRFGWDKIMEDNHVIGLKQVYSWKKNVNISMLFTGSLINHVTLQGNKNISLEAGGQFELSGAPVETLHQTCAEINSHLYQVNFSK
jgi:glutamate--cysteine ligase